LGKTKHPDEAWRFLSFLSSAEYQTDLVRSGLWMPNRTAMYLPENLDVWYNKDVYGEGYEQMVPYFRDAAPYQTGLCTKVAANQVIRDELNLYFSAEGQDIEVTIQNITDGVARNSGAPRRYPPSAPPPFAPPPRRPPLF
jgi:multiple sugar transport system substrate-binding protein